jgi:hypothetical protein
MNVYLSKEPVMTTSKHDEVPHILIFKTNIELAEDRIFVGICLQNEKDVIDWNLDMEDIDKVLRVESKSNNTEKIIQTITKAGFFCEELD